MIDTSVERKVISILVVDDDEDDFIIIREYIKSISDFNIYHVAWCPVYGDALLEICKGYYDIYLIDFVLGAKTGLDLIKESIGNNCERPFILLTGQGSQEIDESAMQAGAADYLVKSELTTEKIERCIRYALSRQFFIKTIQANVQKFRSVFERSQDGVFIAGKDLVFTDVNHAACLMFGFTKEELLLLSLYDFLFDENDRLQITEKLLTGKGLSDTPFELLTRNKEKISCILSISLESDSNGNIYAQGIIHDITSLKKIEKANLLTDKLQSAERLARVLAHEVRNPLNNIGLSSEQLHQEMTAADREIYIGIINRNTKRIDDLITELLNSARSAEIVLSKITLQSVLAESVAAAADRITLRHIALHLDYLQEEAWIMADAEKLKIALLNIMINAVEAMKAENGQLYIGLKEQHNTYIIVIKDNGEGISSENLGRLFEPYYTSKRRGMGLGLGTTVNIIQSHNATIEVQSTRGIGTSFILIFKKLNAAGEVIV